MNFDTDSIEDGSEPEGNKRALRPSNSLDVDKSRATALVMSVSFGSWLVIEA
jgi:hypothetical protein